MIRPYYRVDRDDPGQSHQSSYSSGSHGARASQYILFTCIGVFLLQQILAVQRSGIYDRFMDLFAFAPVNRLGTPYVWQYVTYIFLHDGFWHILLNMYFFTMVGRLVESRIGTRRFLWLFFLSGIAGAIAQQLIFPDSSTLGASAAVMGVAAACTLLYPDVQVLLFFVIPVKMKYLLWVLVAFEIYGVSGIAREGGRVAYFAHLAGLGAGYLFALYSSRAEAWLNGLYYRLRGRFRGFVGNRVTHIDDDQKYRDEVDRLLDKIFKEGTQSLTREESEFLKRQSEKFKKQQ